MIETKLPRIQMFCGQFWSHVGGAEKQAAQPQQGPDRARPAMSKYCS
jgi:hypothetical protein